MIDLRQGDNRAKLRQMIAAGEFVDSVVTDPPYGLVSIAKRFGSSTAAPAKFGTDGAFQRASGGFMGLKWDSTGIERDPEFWRLVFDVMKPGAYIIAFSSSRTYGYMQVAMEAAGFITHPMFGWVFNTGFPKGHDAGKAVDRTLGFKGGRGAPKPGHEGHMGKDNLRSLRESGTMSQEGGFSRPWMYDPDAIEESHYEYAAESEEGQRWKGWKTGTQSLKPALEPVYFGQKPFSEKTGALNILRHGVGAVNIDACRVGYASEADQASAKPGGRATSGALVGGAGYDVERKEFVADNTKGRYPANLMHDGSPEVVALFPESGGQIARSSSSETRKNQHTYGEMARGSADEQMDPRGDSGSAARFFNSFPHEGPIICSPKAGKKDRAGSKHATVKPIGLMQHFVRLITPPGGLVLDPFAGTGTTGQAALNEGMRCVLMEAEPEYARDIRRRFNLPETVSDRLVNLTEAFG